MKDNVHILIVEDSRTQAMCLKHVLEKTGFIVVVAVSAEDALEKLNQTLPDLIVTDYHLPGVFGDDLCRRIRMNVNTRGIPILMLTSLENNKAEQIGLESGADDYVWKSVEDEILLNRIQALLRKNQIQGMVVPEEIRFTARRILIVEDSATYRQFITEEMKQAGYQVSSVGTASEGLERLAIEKFDAVLLDMILPDMSGEAMCRQFTGVRRTLDNAFVLLMLTGEENKEEMNAVIVAGADDVIGKSRDMLIIKARLHALLRRNFFHEENQRIVSEFQEKENALLRARAEKQAAEERASLADQLAETNRELKETQSQLVQSAKMASLGELVAGVAHEINNPLAFVMSHLETIKNAVDTIDADQDSQLSEKSIAKLKKLQQRSKDMHDGLERIRDLVIKLRTFSRLDEGKFKQVDIEECIESVLALLQHRLDENINIIRHYDKDNIINCSPGPLNQVFMNIIANAIDALEGQGDITISTEKSKSKYSVTIADTGSGISDDIRDRIFEPFFTTKPVGQGTGLGLSISYNIVKTHDGKFEIHDGEKGKGTRMKITIPVDGIKNNDAD